MYNPWFYALVSVVLVSLVSLIGLTTLSMKTDTLRRYLPYMLCLGVGAMFGNAFLHMIPESVEHSGTLLTLLMGVAGFGAFFFVEKQLHCKHECAAPGHGEHPVGYMSLFADGLENLVDGAIIAAAYLVDLPTGIAATVAVFVHEIPTEVGDFGVLVHSGFSPKKALVLNLVTGLAAVGGAVLVLTLGSGTTELTHYVIPFAAGAFVYIAAVRLVPRALAERAHAGIFLQALFVLAGFAAMFALKFLE
jgi:Predicted divalent heavy-metal cations transporter